MNVQKALVVLLYSCYALGHSQSERARAHRRANFDSVERCGPGLVGSPENLTQEQVEMYGNCVPYVAPLEGGPCDSLFQPGVDHVYIPYTRANGSLDAVNRLADEYRYVITLGRPQCQEPMIKSLCYFYYPPCGNETQFLPPPALCQDNCIVLRDEMCAVEFESLGSYIDSLGYPGFHFLDCGNPGEAIDPLPYCCFTVLQDANLTSNVSNSTDPGASSSDTTAAVAGASVAALVVILCAVSVVVGAAVTYKWTQRRKIREGELNILSCRNVRQTRHEGYSDVVQLRSMSSSTSVMSPEYLEVFNHSNLVIPGNYIELVHLIGKGEFGIVYRARFTGRSDKAASGSIVAVKTLKGNFTPQSVQSMLQEAIKMKEFSHPNVLSLIGVCIDVGQAPYIVMPFMANGSLLSYLKNERPNLNVTVDDSQELIEDVEKRLLSMCLQIAKGMEYLASMKFVHRDLAARNCMIDDSFVVKVADFGLSEDIYMRNYYRQGKEKGDIKLPIKWMAIESLQDCVFSEKSDVWSFGVTCWEVFSLGKTPYGGIGPFDLISHLEGGERLLRPSNAACTQEMEKPGERPLFSELVKSFSTTVENVAGYLDLNVVIGQKL